MSSDSYALEGVGSSAEALDMLIRRAQAGEESAFEEILHRFEGRALALARQLGATASDSEDITQDVFIKLFKHIDSYQGGRRFKAYFLRIVVNTTRDHLGRRAAREGPLNRGTGTEEQGATATDEAETREWVRQGLARLTPREREIVVLKEIQGLTTWEVARALQLNPITVRRHAMRARERLKKILGF